MSDFYRFFAAFYAQHHQAFRRVASGALRVEADADDVVQDAFVRVLAMEGKDPISSPMGLLTRVTLNLAADRRRGDRVRARHLDPDADWEKVAAPDGTPEQNAEASQLCLRLNETIAGLPPRCREVFILHRFHDLSHADIARRLGISRNMVEKHILRALVDLRRCYDGFGRDGGR